MLKINLIAVGKIKETFIKDAAKEYLKRISRFYTLKVIEVDEATNFANIDKKRQAESEMILNFAKGYIILLDIEGTRLTSPALAEKLESLATEGKSEISFIIGGSNGVSDQLKTKIDYSLSFGKITFPHQLFRVVLLEQIYRAATINNNIAYHK